MSAVIKNIRMFAVILDQGIKVLVTIRGFLYPFDCLYLRYKAVRISCSPLSLLSDGSLVGNERRTAFLIFNNSNFVVTMTKESKICKGAKHSNARATSSIRNIETLLSILTISSRYPETTGVILHLKCSLEYELNAKNRAYDFIIAKGLMPEFCGNKRRKKQLKR